MSKQFVRQHEPLRVPERWSGQDRALVIQLERILDDIYAKLGNIDKEIKKLKEEEENE